MRRAALEISVRRAIQLAWWIGLVGALLATLAILKEVTLVLRALRDIDDLAQLTLEASRGIRTNVAAIAKLDGVGEPVGQLAAAVQDLDLATTELAVTLESIAPEPAAGGGTG